MAKYIIDLPDAYTSESALLGDILSIPITLESGKRYNIPTGVKLTPYTEPDGVKNNKVNLCDSIYPECPSERYDVMFGDGIGKDNICCCAGYRAINEDEIRQKEGEYGEKAWQLFRNICELNGTECIEAFDTISCRTVLDEMTYSEAKANYEAWKKSKAEIRVGDEVNVAGTTGVIVRIPAGDEQRIHYISPSGTVYCNNAYADIIKTGRHFDEVDGLLKKMREES